MKALFAFLMVLLLLENFSISEVSKETPTPVAPPTVVYTPTQTPAQQGTTPTPVETPTQQAGAPAIPKMFEVVPAKDYLLLTPLDPLPPDMLRWDKQSGTLLYLSSEEPPYIFLYGTLMPGHRLLVNKNQIPPRRGKFEYKFQVPLQSTVVNLTIVRSDGSSKSFRLLNHWIKVPPSMRIKVQEGDKIVEKNLGFFGEFKKSAFVQLYSGSNPIEVVDLDSQKHARLIFRIEYPQVEKFDGWTFRIKDSEGAVVGEMKRVGSPPPFVDWREVAAEVFAKDTYTYQVDLQKDQRLYEGTVGTFKTIEGLGVLHHGYLPKIKVEPRADFGFYNFKNEAGVDYSALFTGADLPVVLWDRLIFRATALTTLHSLDTRAVYTYTRVGTGVRIYGDLSQSLLGDLFVFRADLLICHTGFTTYPDAFIKRHSHPALLFETHLVLWTYHYLTPWIEYGMKPGGDQTRISYGASYHFFIRPWQVKFGMGIAYDKLTKLTLNPDLQFKVFRTMAGFTFFL